MELLTWAYVLAFILSVGFNLFQTQVLVKLKQQLSDRDALIDDLRSAVGGKPADGDEAWRGNVL